MVGIITDSSSNITQNEAKQLGVFVMPLTVIFNRKEYSDGIDLDCDEFYKLLLSGGEFPHTAQLTEEQIDGAVQEALKSFDEVLVLPISGALSGSFDRCKKVAARYQNVYAYDAKCTTLMLKMVVLKALSLCTLSAKEVIERLKEYRRKLKLYAALSTLEYLGKGGRISKTVARLGSVLKIKPVVCLNERGEVELVSKQFGMSKSIGYIAGEVAKAKIDFSEPLYCIYTHDDSNALTLFSKIGLTPTERVNICPVIGAHIGPSAAGIVFCEK